MSRFLEERPKGRAENLFSISPVPAGRIHGLWLRTSVYGDAGRTPAAHRVLLGVFKDTRP